MRQICSFNIKNFNEISRTTTTFNLSKMKYKCYVIASIYQRKILVLFGITSFDRIAEMCPIRMICRHQMQSVDHVYADLGRRLIVRIPKKHMLGAGHTFVRRFETITAVQKICCLQTVSLTSEICVGPAKITF